MDIKISGPGLMGHEHCTMHVGLCMGYKELFIAYNPSVITHMGFDVICGSMVRKVGVLVGAFMALSCLCEGGNASGGRVAVCDGVHAGVRSDVMR